MSKHSACPFCGSEKSQTVTDDGIGWVKCNDCGATGPTFSKYSGEEDREYISWESRAYAQALREEVAALRARVVVAPDTKNELFCYSDWDAGKERGWNDCLDELARLNGKLVSEGLLREVKRHLGNWLELHECECEGGLHYCGRDQVAKTHRELRTLLDEVKEDGNA